MKAGDFVRSIRDQNGNPLRVVAIRDAEGKVTDNESEKNKGQVACLVQTCVSYPHAFHLPVEELTMTGNSTLMRAKAKFRIFGSFHGSAEIFAIGWMTSVVNAHTYFEIIMIGKQR